MKVIFKQNGEEICTIKKAECSLDELIEFLEEMGYQEFESIQEDNYVDTFYHKYNENDELVGEVIEKCEYDENGDLTKITYEF